MCGKTILPVCQKATISTEKCGGGSAEPRHLGALRRTGWWWWCWDERKDETHLSVFHSVQLVYYSKTKLNWIHIWEQGGAPGVSGAQSSLCILRIGRIGSGWWQHKAVRWLFIMRDWFSCQSENTANLSLINNLCHCLKIMKHRFKPKPRRKSV